MDHSSALRRWRINLEQALARGQELPTAELDELLATLQQTHTWLTTVRAGDRATPAARPEALGLGLRRPVPRALGPARPVPTIIRDVLYYLPVDQAGLPAGTPRAAKIVDVLEPTNPDSLVNLIVFHTDGIEHVAAVPHHAEPGGWDWPIIERQTAQEKQ